MPTGQKDLCDDDDERGYHWKRGKSSLPELSTLKVLPRYAGGVPVGRHSNHTPSWVKNVFINLHGGLSTVSSSLTGSKTFNGKATECHAVTSDVASSNKTGWKLCHLQLAMFRGQEGVAESWHLPCTALFVACELWETWREGNWLVCCDACRPIEWTLGVDPCNIRCKGCLSLVFDREDVAFVAHSHLCTVKTKGTLRCTTLVWRLATGLGLAAARTACPSVAPERVLGCALITAWRALSMTNPWKVGDLCQETVLWTVCGTNLMSNSV